MHMPIRPRSEASSVTCVRRVAIERQPVTWPLDDVDGLPSMWFVKVTLGGDPLDPEQLKPILERLALERSFVVSVRYDRDRAEIRYWDEADQPDAVAQQAISLWGDEEVAQQLPGWQLTDLQVCDRPTARRQWDRGDHPRVFALGEVLPFD
jgi:hypothetical protein